MMVIGASFVHIKLKDLRLPSSYVEVERDEMEYVDGGSASISVSPAYLSRSWCLGKAGELVNSGTVRGMTELGVAQEIFAHAVCYYSSWLMKLNGIDGSMVDYLHDHANPIDIGDGGDTAARQFAFREIWRLGVV